MKKTINLIVFHQSPALNLSLVCGVYYWTPTLAYLLCMQLFEYMVLNSSAFLMFSVRNAITLFANSTAPFQSALAYPLLP